MTRPSPCALALLLCLPALLVAPGCATKLAPADLPTRIWPEPPDPARIDYRDRITGSAWIQQHQKGFLLREKLGASVNTLNFIKPYDVVVANDGRIFVTDTARGGVIWLDGANRKFGTWGLEGVGTVGKGLGMDLDAEGRLYVVDGLAGRVVVFDDKGKFLSKIGKPEELVRPASVAVDSANDRVYVSDTKGHKIEVYNRAGEHLQTLGERGSEPGQFNFPTFLAVGPQGRLHVADSMNFRIQRFAPDGSFADSYGQIGNMPGYFNRLKGIDVDAEGRVWTVDASFGMVQIFDRDFQLLMLFSNFGSNPGDLNLPAGLDVTDTGDVYVVSQISQTLEVFHLLSDSEREVIEASRPATDAAEAAPPVEPTASEANSNSDPDPSAGAAAEDPPDSGSGDEQTREDGTGVGANLGGRSGRSGLNTTPAIPSEKE